MAILASCKTERPFGIVNSISPVFDWDPNTDQSIYQNYTAKTVHKKKAENKKKLQN